MVYHINTCIRSFVSKSSVYHGGFEYMGLCIYGGFKYMWFLNAWGFIYMGALYIRGLVRYIGVYAVEAFKYMVLCIHGALNTWRCCVLRPLVSKPLYTVAMYTDTRIQYTGVCIISIREHRVLYTCMYTKPHVHGRLV